MKSFHRHSVLSLIFFLLIAQSALSETRTVTVKPGDTLYSLGRRYNVSVQDLISANGIKNPQNLREGRELTIPDTYIVGKGDTLYGIARDNGISVNTLCEMNDITEDTVIKIGQILRVPGRGETGNGFSGSSQRIADSDEDTGTSGVDVFTSESSGSSGESEKSTYVRYNQITDGKNILWPHAGKRSALDGKLQGTEILGSRGDQVVAVNGGEVVWVAPYRGYGTLVMVESKDHHIYAYGGNETTYVDVGQRISSGTVIGRVGINPIEKNAKVFFFVYKDGKPVDPASAPRG